MGRYDAETTTTLHDGRIFDPEKEHDRKKVPAEEIARLHLVTAKGIRFVEWDKRWKRAFLSRMDPVLQAEIKELCRRGAVGSILEIECQALSVAGEIVLRKELGTPGGQRDFQNRWILQLLGMYANCTPSFSRLSAWVPESCDVLAKAARGVALAIWGDDESLRKYFEVRLHAHGRTGGDDTTSAMDAHPDHNSASSRV